MPHKEANDKVTISTFALSAMFPDQESARVYLEGRLWPSGVKCPICGAIENITPRKRGFYRCNACSEDFTVRTDTVFERSHVSLHKWVYAMYLLVTARKGISSMQLSKEIGVTQKTAWFMLHRLREACGNDSGLKKLQGVVQVDETFVGGKKGNKHDRQAADLRGVDRLKKPKPEVPRVLDAIADRVLAYHPKPKSEPAKKRQRRRRKLQPG